MSSRERHFLDLLVSLPLFFTPDNYVLHVENLTNQPKAPPPNQPMDSAIWKRFIDSQEKQWDNGNLLVIQLGLTGFLHTHAIAIQATVMLAVDVSFLTIPGVVVSNLSSTNTTFPSQEIVFTSPALVLIALSIEASVASIVIGMLLIRHNSDKEKDPPTAVSE
jgi:hypothetical protein